MECPSFVHLAQPPLSIMVKRDHLVSHSLDERLEGWHDNIVHQLELGRTLLPIQLQSFHTLIQVSRGLLKWNVDSPLKTHMLGLASPAAPCLSGS